MSNEFRLRDVVSWYGHRAMVVGKTYVAPITYDITYLACNETVVRQGISGDDLELVEQ